MTLLGLPAGRLRTQECRGCLQAPTASEMQPSCLARGSRTVEERAWLCEPSWWVLRNYFQVSCCQARGQTSGGHLSPRLQILHLTVAVAGSLSCFVSCLNQGVGSREWE